MAHHELRDRLRQSHKEGTERLSSSPRAAHKVEDCVTAARKREPEKIDGAGMYIARHMQRDKANNHNKTESRAASMSLHGDPVRASPKVSTQCLAAPRRRGRTRQGTSNWGQTLRAGHNAKPHAHQYNLGGLGGRVGRWHRR